MADLSIWVLRPATHAEDPTWQDRRIWNRVIVAAESPAFARLAAEDWALNDGVKQPGNESPSRIAGFRDERLYSIEAAPQDEWPELIPATRAVVGAE